MTPYLKGEVIPLVSTYCNNYSTQTVVKQANFLLQNCPNDRIRKCYKDKKVILATKQPPSILRQLTSAKFEERYEIVDIKGIKNCINKNCELCRLGYLVECETFVTSNGKTWRIPTLITCNSKMVIYFLTCTSCKMETNTGIIETNIGKTNILRSRMNTHRSSCRLGNSTDKFDNHVFKCNKDKKNRYLR